jgi:hypothetical protein
MHNSIVAGGHRGIAAHVSRALYVFPWLSASCLLLAAPNEERSLSDEELTIDLESKLSGQIQQARAVDCSRRSD